MEEYQYVAKSIKRNKNPNNHLGRLIRTLSLAAFAGCITLLSHSSASAETLVTPVLDSLHDSGAKIPNTDNIYPSSEYTLTEISLSDTNNLPVNVIKYYNSEDKTAHYYELNFKQSEYGEGNSTKYFKWSKDENGIKLVETDSASEANLTIHYNPGDTINRFNIDENNTIDSINEIYIGKDLKNIVGSIGSVGNISSKFIGNTSTIDSTASSSYTYSTIYTGIGGKIDSITSSFLGNNINIDSTGNRLQGSLIKVLGDGTVNTLTSEFIGNNVNITSQGTEIHGGLIYAASDGVIRNLTSDFIRNTTTTASNNGSDGAIYGAIIRTDGTTNITCSKFIENRGISSANDYLYGGTIYNQGTSNSNGLTITDTIFEGNSLKSGGNAYGGAIYNAGKLTITNTSFKDNYASGTNARGGAIFTQSDMTLSANNGKTTEFSGNYTLNGSTKDNEAIYVNNSNATLTLNATDSGTILLSDKINGLSGYNVVLSGDSTGTIDLYNAISNANIRANSVNIDMSDNNFMTYDFLSLASENTAKYSIDVNFKEEIADKFNLGNESRGTIYISDLTMLGGAPTTSKLIQILTGPDTIAIELSDDLINKYYKVTEREYSTSDELKSSAIWGETFASHDYKETKTEGLRTAITGSDRTSADSLEYYVNKEVQELGSSSNGDTMAMMNQSDKFAEKTFTAGSADAVYTLGADLGRTTGTFTVNGYNSGSKNVVDANSHAMFDIGDNATVNLNYLTINNLANSDGSLMKIAEDGTGSLNSVNVNGNVDTAAILNDGTLNLNGNSSSEILNTFTGGGIKGAGTTNVNNGIWDFAQGTAITQDLINITGGNLKIFAEDLQGTVLANSSLTLKGGTLSTSISGSGNVYIDGDTTLNADVTAAIQLNKAGVNLTTNANHLKSTITQYNVNNGDTHSILTLTGGTVTKNINGSRYWNYSSNYYIDLAVRGDVTVSNNVYLYIDKFDISEGSSLTISTNSMRGYNYNNRNQNNGVLNLTGGYDSYFRIYGTGTTNILGNVSLTSTDNYIVQDTVHIKEGAELNIDPDNFGAIPNFINDGILTFTNTGSIDSNTITAINGTGKTQIGSTYSSANINAYSTDFNQDLEILKNGSLSASLNKNFTNIKNDGKFYICNNYATSSSSHGLWTHDITGEGTTTFLGSGYYSSGTMYIDNQAQIDTDICLQNSTYLWSNADLLGGKISFTNNYSSLYLTGGTINHQISLGSESSNKVYIDSKANVISNALIEASAGGGTLYLLSSSTLTIAADNLDADVTLNSGSNLKLTSGKWDNKVNGSSYGTVTILSGEEVTHDTTGGSGKDVSATINIEDGAKFTASASNLTGTVNNEGSLYLSGVLNRKYSGTGTTYIDETLHVSSGAGFPATFDLNEGHLISDGIATYTFGHTTNSGAITFNVNAAGSNSDLFNLASTSDAVFDIRDVVFGTYKTPSFTNTVKTYQILKGSPSYLTLGEPLQKDITIYDSVRDQLGVNIYTEAPENLYFDDPYNTRHTSGTVSATVELATTENNHDSVKITYGDYESNDYVTRLDLLHDWNILKTSNERNFNFKTADDVYTSLQAIGKTTTGTLNINGISTTSTDDEGNTIIKRSVIDLDNHSGFNIAASLRVLNLSNVEFRNGTGWVIVANENGASLSPEAIQGNIVNCLFKNNTNNISVPSTSYLYTYGGGAIGLNKYTIVHQILNSTFENNSVDYTKISGSINSAGGGAIWITSDSTINNIANCQFNNNNSYGNKYQSGGGAIFNSGIITNITNSIFSKNFATYRNCQYTSDYYIYGGAIYNRSGTITNITDCTFENNNAYYNGGAIANNYSGIIDTISNSTFNGNRSSYSSSPGGGGAIYNDGGTINTISRSNFENNSSPGYGGAIDNSGTINTINVTTFKNNYSYNNGGAICNYSRINTINGATFKNNYSQTASSSSGGGGAIYNSGTINTISGTTFENNSASSSSSRDGGAIYNTGTISEILNSTFTGNNSHTFTGNNSNPGGAIYNSGTINIVARDIVEEDGEITKGLTEFTGNYSGSSRTESNNYAIYNYTTSGFNPAASITLKAENNGIILMNDKIVNGKASSSYAMSKLNLTGDSTGTIKLFDTISGGEVTANNVNINTANGKTQNYSFNNFSTEDTAKWTIDIDFTNKTADTFNVGDGTGTMYIDSLNILGNADKYTIVKVLDRSIYNSTGLVLKDAVTDIRNNLSNTVYNDDTFHQQAGYAVVSGGAFVNQAYYRNYAISQCIDEELDPLNLIASSDMHEERNFIFRDGSTYTLQSDLDDIFEGTLNIKGVEGAGSTIDANGHKLFKLANEYQAANHTLNLSDVKLTGADTLIESSSSYSAKVGISGSETTLDGKVCYTDATLNSGNLRISTDTFDTYSSLTINDGTLALNNGGTETYNIYKLTPGEKGKLALDIDLTDKVSDQISLTVSSGIITVSSIDLINGTPENGSFVVQVLKNGSNSTTQLALDESIKHYIFDEYSDVIADEIQIDTDFGHNYYNRLYTGTAYGDLSLAKTRTDNDSIRININAAWNDNPEIVDSMGDTLYLVNSSNLNTRNFNSADANEVYKLSVDLDKTAAGNLNLNGVLGDNGSRSTINFKNHKAFQIGDDTNLKVNNVRLTGARNIINVDSSNTDITLNNAYINGSILGSEKFNILIDGTDTTTIMGAITNAAVTFKNGGLEIAENTFADDSVSLNVQKDAYVYLNDADISNYHFSNIESSSSSKYGLDLDLETRQADIITAEGNGRIVFEKFDIVNRNLSYIDIGEDYTIRILHTSNDSLQLAISETVQMQLAKEYKLGTVHEIIRMDEVVPVAQWTDKWEVEEGDYDVYGKLKLATSVTTNDSLHLYELRKELGSTNTSLGDTLMLLSIFETNEDRRFYTDTVARYDLSVDIGEVSAGKLSLEGTIGDNQLSVIDLHNHKGFKLSNETEMSASNIEFVNAGYKDGSLFNLTNENAVLNLAAVTINETAATNAIKNDGTVNFTSSRNLLYSGITGTGVTNINKETMVHLEEGLSITQDAINVSGYLSVADNSQLAANLTVASSGTVLLADANALTSDVKNNNGEILISNGTLQQNISGTGSTWINFGSVINEAKIDQDVYIDSLIGSDRVGLLTTSADNIGGVIHNGGIVNLTGTLKNVITHSGTTNVNKTLTLADGAGIEGTLNLNDGAVSTNNSTISKYVIGTMLNEGSFDIDVDLAAKTSDLFEVGANSDGLVHLDSINFMNNTILQEGESIIIQVLKTNGTDTIQIALDEALKADRIVVGTESEIEDDLHANVYFDEKFHDSGRIGTIYATIAEGTTNTHNDSIELSYSGIEWGESGSIERLDTLKELGQYATDEEKNFNFKTKDDTYTAAEDLGTVTDGVFNINGVAEGSDKSEIDLNDHSGFELNNETTLNIKDVTIGGGKDNKLISAGNPDAVINIENTTLNGNIDGSGTSINIGGNSDDTTVLNGVITNSNTNLNDGTLKFNPDTFGDENDTLTINFGRVDVKDDEVNTYDINKLTSSGTGRYSIDVDLNDNTSDKFTITDQDSSGTVYIDDINFVNGEMPDEFKSQILDTNSNDQIQIKLSDEIKNQIFDFGTVEKNWDDLKASINFDEKFHDFTQLGDIYGSIKEATTTTTNDSIELVKKDPVWREHIDSEERLDTLHEISAYITDDDKTFNFKTASDLYSSKANVGDVIGNLTINGFADNSDKSEIDLSGYSGFELVQDTTLTFNNLIINHGKDNTLISSNVSGGVINIKNNTLNGNILGNDTVINISGQDSDTTVLNGVITDSNTTFDGGTLKFNTNTFADSQDTLTVKSGKVTLLDGAINTYDITKLISSETGHYTIDIDLSSEKSDKLVLTDTTSSGIVYIDDIRYLNGDITKKFITQVLDTNGNDKIQIKLSDEIKNKLYDLDTTERNWNDLKASVNFDEKFHDFSQIGDIRGQIKEATTSTTNDSIELVKNAPDWREHIDSEERLDTLHEISVYETDQNKTFNFKTSADEYVSNADAGVVNGTLTVNGVFDGTSKSAINFAAHNGFELTKNTELNLNNVNLNNGKSENLVIALAKEAIVNIKNGTLNGNIRGNDTLVNIIGEANDTTILNGIITDSTTTFDGGILKFNTNTFADNDDSLIVKSGRVDIQDSEVKTYDINKLTSAETGSYSIDIDLSSQKGDQLNITDETSSGVVYIDNINYINGELPAEFSAKILETNGNNNIQIKLSDEIKNTVYNFGTTEKKWNDLKADVDFDEIFQDYTQIGDLRGSIKEATTKTTNDSISLKIDKPIWRDHIDSEERLDTLHEISVYETDKDKTFNFKTSEDEYISKADADKVNGTLSVNGVSDNDAKSKIDLAAHKGFEITEENILNLTDVELANGADNTLITSNTSEGGIVNVINTTLNGNISGNNTQINITGEDDDITLLNGLITNSKTIFDGGTLEFNTDTFADKNDSLTVNSGRVNIQDSEINTYDINKLTSSENGKFSIDIDLSSQKGDSFNISDKTSSGVVYIDDINYINGELPSEFLAQILETNGNNNIQLKLSDDIKNKVYDFGKTKRDWNDLKADVNFDEIFHDFHQEGDLKGSIKEATTKTTNDSISLKMEAPIWGEIDTKDRLDTLHEISVYSEAAKKTFNFKTNKDEYESKADVGAVAGELSVNGVKAANKYSKINLKGHKGFELVKDSKLNINNTLLANGAEDILISAKDESGVVTLNNSQVSGKITGTKGYTVNITGDNNHIFDLRNSIDNAKVNIDTIQMDVYNTFALAKSDVYMNSGTLNLTADRRISDISANKFTINGTFNMLADADLQAQTMDKLPQNTSLGSNNAFVNVTGINLLSDTTAKSVAIPFAYQGFKDNVKYSGSELSEKTQITTAYAPIYKYDVRYDNRDDMGYFVFSRHSSGGGNSSDSFNPSVLASPVSTQTAGNSAMNEAFRYVFEHADAFTQLPMMDRFSQINANQTALSTDFNHNLGSLCTEHNNKAAWYRPYTTFESIDLKNGPTVSSISYGSLVGYDSDFYKLKNGWTNVGTGYIGYYGSQLDYRGVDTTMNGGLVGITETFYKDNFWTAITATTGVGIAESHTMYGKEDSTMLMAGIGSKTGYNFEFKEGKYIIQPIMFMSYTFVNTFDYTNAAGVRIENDPMHTIQLNPHVRFIANLKNGMQPYASAGVVWNLMNESSSHANGVKLPEMQTKPYVEYGIGLQKNMKDRFTAFGQAMIRNGGRTSISFTAGFRWALGKDHDHNHEHQEVKLQKNNLTAENGTKILKQLSPSKKAVLKSTRASAITIKNVNKTF